jgi:hypothetical protein
MAKSVVAFSLEEFDPTYTRVLVGNANFTNVNFTNLGTLEVITGFANFSESQVENLGNLTTIGGDAYFLDSQVKNLGNLTTIGQDTNFQFSELKDLGNLITIGGTAVFGQSEIKDLGNLTTIGRDANFYQSQIMDLRNLETIGRNAYFNDSEVKSLGNLRTILGNADFWDSQVENLGNLNTIKGYVNFGERTDLEAEWENRSSKDNFKTGGQPLSKTPAPKKDQIKGSDKNKEGSSKDTKSAEKIEFNEKTLETIKNKVAEHNEKNPNKKVTLASAKAVVRRGMGAYSSTHRPTISGGKPNSRVAWGLARLNAFFYKIINGKSKSGKYIQDDDLINELGYKVQKYEIGGIFQGTPHDFNYYSTEYIGTGEGLQAFGWGLYFTEIKDIAKNYAKNEMLIQKEISRKSDNSALLWIYTNISDNVVDKLGYLKIKLKEFEELKKEYKKDTWDDKIEAYSTLIDIIQNYQGKIYSVTLFKGEKETDYHLIKWENPLIVDDLVKIFEEAEKIGGIEFKNGWELDEKYGLTNERGYKITGEEMYVWLSKQLGSDKEASLFLLRAGIDGIKYKSGTLSGMSDKEGYNYVIFDSNDITIEGKEKFADGGLIAPNGKPSNLTPEQYKLVRTNEFKAWFGDWENDPANSSKVINKETKEPLVVYHGSRSTVNFAFSEFKIPQEGVFFSSDYTTASWFSSGAYSKLFFEKIEIPKHLSENSDIKDLEKYFKEKLDPTAFTEINEITDIKNGKIFKTGDINYRLYTEYESVSSPLGRTKELAQKRLYKEILDTIDYKNNQETRPFYHTFLKY